MTCNKSFDAHITRAFSRARTAFPRADIASISRRNNATNIIAARRDTFINSRRITNTNESQRAARIALRAYAERRTIITLRHEDSHGNLLFATHRVVLIKQYRLIRNSIVNSRSVGERSGACFLDFVDSDLFSRMHSCLASKNSKRGV